jgi:flagellar motor switch protein FliM
MSNDQIRAIALVNDGIARRLTNTMGAWLRTQVQIGLTSTEPMVFMDYLQAMPERVYICVLRLEPLGGMALLELELSLVLAIVDLLLGGKGTSTEVREITEIEDTILESVLEIMMRELNEAWEAVGLRFAIDGHDTVANVARLLQPAERTLCVSFLMQMQDTSGTIKFCLPAVVLNTIHRRLIAVKEQPQRRFEAGSQRVAQLAGTARFKAALRLPPVKISSRDIRALEPGYVLQLNLPRTARAEMVVAGIRVSAAAPVGRGDRRSALIERPLHSTDENNSAGAAMPQLTAGEQR